MASSLGYCEALLFHLKDIALNSYPGRKVTPPGFTEMLYQMPERPTVIQQAYEDGHRRSAVNIKYKVRSTSNYVNTSPSCAVDIQPLYKETTASAANYVQLSFFVPDNTIRQYCKEASNMVAVNGSPSVFMQEHYDSMLHQLNGLYQSMDNTLLGLMAAQFGTNVTTGNNATKPVNFTLDGTQNNLQQNYTTIAHDMMRNEFTCQNPFIVGSGNFAAWDLQAGGGAQSFNQSGIDQSRLARYRYFNDEYAAAQWGDNQIGVFDEGSAHIIEDIRYRGSFRRDYGMSFFTTFVDPSVQCRTATGNLGFVTWDLQGRFLDCPTTETDGYAGGTQTYGPGWQFIISKYYGLFTTPTDAYDGADRLAGNNGTMRYTIQNA